jgi:8-oxo-dGTP pyrophosphatase MutT (NUDIX family)
VQIVSEIILYSLNNDIKVNYTGKRVALPSQYLSDCEAYWLSLTKTGKKYFRGDVFTVSKEVLSSDGMELSAELTDYAHFIYTINRKSFDKYDCRSIYASTLIITADNKFVVGIMGRDTFAPGKLQLAGGGVDKGDVLGDRIDLEHCIRKEIKEEIGIDAGDPSAVKSFLPYLLKTGGPSNFYSAIFRLDLTIDESGLSHLYERYVHDLIRQGESPEFEALLFIPADTISIEDLAKNNPREKDENLIPAMRAAIGLYPIKNFRENNRRT